MSIYKQVMGDEFLKLHPMLQRRYELHTFQAKGVMKKIKGGPKFLFPFVLLGARFKLLFPESGKNIPFKITNTTRYLNGEEQVHWKRIFYFRKKQRYFNAVMSLDSERVTIKDYLGEPSLFYSDLEFTATGEGHLRIESKNQRFVLGNLEIPLPRIFQGLANVTEKYIEDRNVFHISVIVKNPLIGIVFAYEGGFTPNDIS